MKFKKFKNKLRPLVKSIPIKDEVMKKNNLAIVPLWVEAAKGVVPDTSASGEYYLEVAWGPYIKRIDIFESSSYSQALEELAEYLLYITRGNERVALDLCKAKDWWDIEERHRKGTYPCACGSGLLFRYCDKGDYCD